MPHTDTPAATATASPRGAAAAAAATTGAAEAGAEALPREQLLHGREVPGARGLQQLLLLPHGRRGPGARATSGAGPRRAGGGA